MLKKSFLIGSLCILATGCASLGESERPTTDPAIEALQKSAGEVSRSFELMASIEQGNAAPPIMPKPTSADLHAVINLPAWTGPMEKATEAVANQIGYRVSVLGKPRSVEPIVTIDARGKAAYEVLRNIGLQGGTTAGLRVDTRDRTITVIYQ